MPKCPRCDHTTKAAVTKCPKCGSVAAALVKRVSQDPGMHPDGTILLAHIPDSVPHHQKTGHWDRNIADPWGVPDDCVILIAGAPGAGKSTFSLQLSHAFVEATGREVLYLPSEENGRQVKARAKRLGFESSLLKLRAVPRETLNELTFDHFKGIIKSHKVAAVVLDSISGFVPDPQYATQLVNDFKQLASEDRVTIILVSHVNKDEEMAGKMSTQHEGDITLLLTKSSKGSPQKVRYVRPDLTDEANPYFVAFEVRELFTEKSRYGPSGQSTYYVMGPMGLIPVEYDADGPGFVPSEDDDPPDETPVSHEKPPPREDEDAMVEGDPFMRSPIPPPLVTTLEDIEDDEEDPF